MSEYSKTIEVKWADLDPNQHLRHSVYGDYATHVRVEWLADHGFSIQRMAELSVAPVNFEDRTFYLKEIRLGDRVTVDLELVGLSEDASRYHLRQAFYRDGEVCARHEIKGGWIDLNRRKLAPPPQGLIDATRALRKAEDFAVIPSSKPSEKESAKSV
ncbi:acyl-CoA thioesterase [Chitinimonas lacunae]|uniref:Acyl-CoA thioesterase n=1 Tax=Chitinimonas lacunae TaxID=1963018 RepID=A0ABV8MT38_9NEIS